MYRNVSLVNHTVTGPVYLLCHLFLCQQCSHQILNGILAESQSERWLIVGLKNQSNLHVPSFTDLESTTKIANLSPVKIYTNLVFNELKQINTQMNLNRIEVLVSCVATYHVHSQCCEGIIF